MRFQGVALRQWKKAICLTYNDHSRETLSLTVKEQSVPGLKKAKIQTNKELCVNFNHSTFRSFFINLKQPYVN